MTSCTPLYNTVLWGQGHQPSPVIQPGFLTRWTLTKELGFQVKMCVHQVGQKTWLDCVPFTALSQPSCRRMSCVCTWSDAKTHNAAILPKANHITHPLLVISEIKATVFIIYIRNELGTPHTFIVMMCLFHTLPYFCIAVNMSRLHRLLSADKQLTDPHPWMGSVLSCVETPHTHGITSHSAARVHDRGLFVTSACCQTNQGGVDAAPNVN